MENKLSEYGAFFFKYTGYKIKNLNNNKVYRRGDFWDIHRVTAIAMLNDKIPDYIELVKD